MSEKQLNLVAAKVEDLATVTYFFWHINLRRFRNKICVGLERMQPNDRSLVFSILDLTTFEKETCILSHEFFVTHDFWKKGVDTPT